MWFGQENHTVRAHCLHSNTRIVISVYDETTKRPNLRTWRSFDGGPIVSRGPVTFSCFRPPRQFSRGRDCRVVTVRPRGPRTRGRIDRDPDVFVVYFFRSRVWRRKFSEFFDFRALFFRRHFSTRWNALIFLTRFRFPVANVARTVLWGSKNCLVFKLCLFFCLQFFETKKCSHFVRT